MPVFDINMQDTFPMPTLQQGSPFGGVLSGAIAKRLAMANAKKAEAEVPYAGLSSLASAMSKGAYATGMPIQNLVNTMKNSKQWANMTENQQAGAIAAVYNQAASQSGLTPIFNSLMQKELSKLDTNKPKSGLLDSLQTALGKVGSVLGLGTNQNQEANPVQQVNPSQNQTMMQGNANPTEVAPLPADQQSTLPVTSPNRGDASRAVANEANYNEVIAGSNAEGGEIGKQSAEQMKRVQEISNTAQNMDQLIDSAVAKRKTAFLKGPGLGKLAKYGPDAAQALKDTNMMVVTMADQLFGAGSTDAKQAAAGTLKLNMEDPDKAFDEVAIKMKAQNDRLKHQGTFYQTAKQLGITNPSDRDQLWFDYNAKQPPYDYKNHKPIYKNLGLDQHKMAKFINDNRANPKLFNKRIESTLKEQTKDEEKKFVNKKGKDLHAQTPEEWHSGKAAQESKRINGKRMLKIGDKWYEEE